MWHNTVTRYRYTPNELHARMVVTVGVLLAIVFSMIVLGMIWGLLFVSQPLEQSPNDADFISLLSTLTVFMTGTLSGLVAAHGLKRKPAETTNGTPAP